MPCLERTRVVVGGGVAYFDAVVATRAGVLHGRIEVIGALVFGNLCNTASGRGATNAKLARRNGSVVASVYATRDIAPGDEILVPYGAGYTRELRERAGLPEPPEEPAGEAQPWAYNLPQWRPCPRCSKRMLPKQLARHVGLGNCRWTAGEGRRSSSQQSTRASATPRTRSAAAA